MSDTKNKGLNISAKSFITAIGVIFALMVGTYILTFIIPAGAYPRTVGNSGDTIIDIHGEFAFVEGGIPFWKWLLSPILLLGAEGSGTTIAVTVFLLVIGGIFNCLDKHGLMKYMLDRIVSRFARHRYGLMAVVVFFFMMMGACIGSFEECVPMVPIVVALALGLGWDALTGIGMSLLAAGCGFASGVCNPFTVGVAQELAGLPMFSGIWLRAVGFVLIYGLLLLFLRRHAGKVERPVEVSGNVARNAAGNSAANAAGSATATIGRFQVDPQMDRGLLWFVLLFGVGIACVFCSGFLTFLQDYTMIIVAVTFLVAGIVALLVSGMGGRQMGSTFLHGVVSVLPAVAMILMASSIKYTMTEAGILDTILYYGMGITGTLPAWAVILFLYLVVLVLNFFIPSGSAKAFLLIPLIVPLAEVFDISAQLCIMAFAFGDGFSNAFYPTNPVLLISLGLVDVSYAKWVKWSWKFQLCNLLLTSLILLFGLAVGYA